MNNSKEAYNIGRYLRKKFVAAIKPDHPLTFSGPDVLIGNKGNLFGIFIPKQVDFRDHFFFYSRIINSKLAYPENMKVILLFNEDFEREWDFKSPLNWPIDYSLALNKKKDLVRTLEISYEEDNRSYFNSRVRSHWNRVYESIYPVLFNEESNLVRFHEERQLTRKELARGRSNTNEIGYSIGFNIPNPIEYPTNFQLSFEDGEIRQYAKIPENIKRVDVENYSEDLVALHSSFMVSAEMDSYEHKGVLFLEVDNFPSYRFDPLKTIRAMTFLGIAPYHKSLGMSFDSFKNKIQENYFKVSKEF